MAQGWVTDQPAPLCPPGALWLVKAGMYVDAIGTGNASWINRIENVGGSDKTRPASSQSIPLDVLRVRIALDPRCATLPIPSVARRMLFLESCVQSSNTPKNLPTGPELFGGFFLLAGEKALEEFGAFPFIVFMPAELPLVIHPLFSDGLQPGAHHYEKKEGNPRTPCPDKKPRNRSLKIG